MDRAADYFLFPPWLHDDGRDDCLFNEAFQHARGSIPQRDALSAPLLFDPFHDSLTSGEKERNHGD